MRDLRPLRNEADYEWALAELETCFDNEPQPGTPDGDRMEILITLVGAYEDQHWPIDPPDQLSAVRFRMEQAGFEQKDLARLLGSRSRASEFLRGRRPLTMAQALLIHQAWNVPAQSLLRVAAPDRARA